MDSVSWNTSLTVRFSSGPGTTLTSLRNSRFPAASIRKSSSNTSTKPATRAVALPSRTVTNEGTGGPAAGAGAGAGGAGGVGWGACACPPDGGGAGALPEAASLTRWNGRPIVRSLVRALVTLSGARSTKLLTGPDSAKPPTTNSPSTLNTTTDAPSAVGRPSPSSNRTTGRRSAWKQSASAIGMKNSRPTASAAITRIAAMILSESVERLVVTRITTPLYPGASPSRSSPTRL